MIISKSNEEFYTGSNFLNLCSILSTLEVWDLVSCCKIHMRVWVFQFNRDVCVFWCVRTQNNFRASTHYRTSYSRPKEKRAVCYRCRPLFTKLNIEGFDIRTIIVVAVIVEYIEANVNIVVVAREASIYKHMYYKYVSWTSNSVVFVTLRLWKLEFV